MSSEYGTYVSRAAQSEWMHSLRPNIAYVDFVFNDGDDGHQLLEQLAHLQSTRTVGVEAGNGYDLRPRPTAITRRYDYDRAIIRAIDDLGCFWPDSDSPERWTGLGDVDVVFLDRQREVLGATVTHEGMIVMPDDEHGHGPRR